MSFPANEMAKVSGFKQQSDDDDEIKAVTGFQGNLPIASTDRVWDSSEAIARIRTFTNSTDAPSATYRRNFMWFDSAEPENFGSYKLPFVDIIDGRRVAIPRAINNIAARLSGTDIPQADKTRIQGIVSRYQDKFKKSYDLHTIKTLGKRGVEDTLRELGFSQSAAVYIASQLPGEPAPAVSNDDDLLSKALSSMMAKADNMIIEQKINRLLTR